MKSKPLGVKNEPMQGECFEHDLRWFSGGIECPVCKLEARLLKIKEAAENVLRQVKIDGLRVMDAGGKIRIDDLASALESEPK